MGAIGGEFFLLIHHHQTRRGPRLAGFADPAPHFVIGLEHAATDEVVAGLFREYRGIHSDARRCIGIHCLARIQNEDSECGCKDVGESKVIHGGASSLREEGSIGAGFLDGCCDLGM